MPVIAHVGRTRLIAVAACLFAPCGVSAQSIHGVVRGDASGTVLSGVVVVLRDSSSGDLAQAVTNSGGAFVLRAPAAGRYLLRARHIGFRPADVTLRLSRGDTSLVIAMREVPTALAAVTTRRTGQCRAHPESGSATWALWENTEVTMLNAAITMREQPYRFDAEFASREYELDAARLTDIVLRDSTIRDNRPWTTVRPDVLARSGFAVETATAMTVIAPDLPVLLSRDFLDGHCFAIHAASASRPELVGLDFEPIARRHHVDIRGTFWLDQQSGEVRYLDYYYDGFPFSMVDTLAGGRVNFTRLSTGSWILSSWRIRAPSPPLNYLQRIATTANFDASRSARPVQNDDPLFRATDFKITGGGVREVRRSEGTDSSVIWSAPVSALRATVSVQSDAGPVAAAGATVRLVGSRRQAVTDSSGVARIERLMEGDYIVEVASSEQAALRLQPMRKVVAVAPPADATLDALVMSAKEAIHAACGDMIPTRGILVGTVTRKGVPEPRAHVIVRSEVDPHLAPTEVRTSSDGTFRVCDLPRGEELTVRVILADPTLTVAAQTQARIRVTIAAGRTYETIDLVVPPGR